MTGGQAEPKGKIFCIGLNKTGTTSLQHLFRTLDYRIGDQAIGELLLDAWSARRFEPIVWLAGTAEFFQDVPFSCPDTYRALDLAFDDAKFILSVRDDAEQWYESMVSFHTAIIGKKRIPTFEDLREYPYRYPGWLARAMKGIFNVDDDDPYERDHLIRHYTRYNDNVMEYFRGRPDRLLVINLAEDGAAETIFRFIGKEYDGRKMPHLNRWLSYLDDASDMQPPDRKVENASTG